MINFSSYIKSLNKELTKEQETNIVESEKYVEKHKLDQLFNELLAQIIWKQPEDIKDALKQELENIKENKQIEGFFDPKDFEILFENYDVSKQGSIKFSFVVLILQAVGIEYDAEKYKQSFGKDITNDTLVTKAHFLDIITKEYKQNINK